MLYAKNGRQLNLAAKTISKALKEHKIVLAHQDAMMIVAKLLGYSSVGAANAALTGQKKERVSSVKSWRDLAHALGTLPDEQLDMSITVSEGCDVDGNAEFFPAYELLLAGDPGLLAASDGVLEPQQPVLLFNGPEPEETSSTEVLGVTLEFLYPDQSSESTPAYLDLRTGEVVPAPGSDLDLALIRHPDLIARVFVDESMDPMLAVHWDNATDTPHVHPTPLKKVDWYSLAKDMGWRRLGAQLELQGHDTEQSTSLLQEAQAQGLGPVDTAAALSKRFDAYFSVGPFVVYSPSENGYFNVNFGWVHDPESASGVFAMPSMVNPPSDLELVPYGLAMSMGE